MDAKTAQLKLNQLSHFKGTPRKRWDATKKFAAECQIDVKQFNKGLGQAWDKAASYAKGAADTASFVAVDERSFKEMRGAIAKVETITKGYRAIITAKIPKSKNDPAYFAWKALEFGLDNFDHRGKELLKAADKAVKNNK